MNMESEIYGADVWNSIQENFPHLKGSVYLDHAGSALYSQAQLTAVFNELSANCYGNPHSRNPSSNLCSEMIEKTRLQVLNFFNADPNVYSLVFTSGATDSLKLIGENFNFFSDPCQSGIEKACGSFVYLRESHTSVVGMREYMLHDHVPTYSLPGHLIDIQLADPEKYCHETTISTEDLNDIDENVPNSLFVYSAQCNFSGYKYPLKWIERTQQGLLNLNNFKKECCINETDTQEWSATAKWHCLLDAASFVSTNQLDLSVWHPDFVALSFYKIMGFPTGLGALIIHQRAHHTLKKRYFGGGTVEMFSSARNLRVDRRLLHERFEDGTVNFLSILSLSQSLAALRNIASMELISLHTFHLAQYLHGVMRDLKYDNGRKLVQFYTATDFRDRQRQGAIVTFNLKKANGDPIGYAQVEKILSLYDIHVRTGCFCNPAACQHYLQLTEDDIQSHHKSGHKCGDENDIVHGRPTGAVRVSFGYMSRKSDADRLVEILHRSFILPTLIGEVSLTTNCDEISNESVERNVTLVGIHVYPIKSCGSFNPQSWPITQSGLLYDRQWVIVNAAGAVLTQKREAKLCFIIPEIDLIGKRLILHHRNKSSSISLPLEAGLNGNSTCHTKICGKTVGVNDWGEDAGQWLSHVLDQPGLRLLRNENTAGTQKISSLANDSPFLFINRKSALSLEQQTISSGSPSSSSEEFVKRFRANLVIDGLAAFEEENWKTISIDRFIFKNMGSCYRCQMICIDQSTASRDQQPLSTLAKSRGNKLPFGIHLELTSTTDNQNQQLPSIEIGYKLKCLE